MRLHPLALALFTSLCSLSLPVLAQKAPAIPAPASIPVLQGEIVIDGKPDEAAWHSAAQFDLAYEIQPGENIAAPVKTTMRMAYSTDALYVSFVAHDPDPKAIRAHLRDRDGGFNDDFVGLMLDTFDDQRRAYEFFVNPLGVQIDLIREEANGNEDASWDGLWSSASAITADGYTVELRIPFSTLRFRNTQDIKRWAVVAFRSYPRDVRHQLASVPFPRSANCMMCQWQKIDGMAAVHQGRNLEVVPSLTMGVGETRDTAASDPARRRWSARDSFIEPGLDVSWAPSPAMTLNATLNPDFSQVESDQLQLNINDSFALFLPEKRPFFMEGADYFNTLNPAWEVLYTRQVADPDFGARVTGRTASGAYGAFLARDAVTQVLVPGVLGSRFETLEQKANVAVGRYRHDLNANTSVGVIGTFRHGDRYSNDLVGVDGRWQRGAHTVVSQFMRTQSQYPMSIVNAYQQDLGNDTTPTGNAFRVYYGFSNRNWSFNTAHQQIDPGFRADLGFIGQVGYRKSVIGGGHTWYRNSGFRRINVYSDWDITHRFDGQLLERELEASVNLNDGPMQSQTGLNALTRVRYWKGRMFNEHTLSLWGNFIPRGGLRIGLSANLGQVLDQLASRTGHRAQLGVWGNADIGRGFNVSLDGNRQRLTRDGGTAFQASVLNATGAWQMDPRQRLRLTVQGSEVVRDPRLYAAPLLPITRPVNKTARDWAAQLVYSYKLNPHTALYAGTTYGAFMDDAHPDLLGNTRSVFLKMSYGWQP